MIKDKIVNKAPLGYVLVAVFLFLSVFDYFRVLFSNDKYISLRGRSEVLLSQVMVLLLGVFFILLYRGLKSGKKWSYWVSLLVFILTLFTLPFGGFNVTGIGLLLAGLLIGIDKSRYVN